MLWIIEKLLQWCSWSFRWMSIASIERKLHDYLNMLVGRFQQRKYSAVPQSLFQTLAPALYFCSFCTKVLSYQDPSWNWLVVSPFSVIESYIRCITNGLCIKCTDEHITLYCLPKSYQCVPCILILTLDSQKSFHSDFFKHCKEDWPELVTLSHLAFLPWYVRAPSINVESSRCNHGGNDPYFSLLAYFIVLILIHSRISTCPDLIYSILLSATEGGCTGFSVMRNHYCFSTWLLAGYATFLLCQIHMSSHLVLVSVLLAAENSTSMFLR